MRYIIVGATAAGTTAAAKLRRIIAKEDTICMYERQENVSFGGCGLPFFIADYFSSVDDLTARTPDKFIASGIDTKVRCEVLSIDPEKKTIQVRNLETSETFSDSYDKLLIATGAESVKLPTKITQGAESKIFYLRTRKDGLLLKENVIKDSIQKVAVLGGGFIGLELLEALTSLKKKEIHLIEANDQVMGRTLSKKMSDWANTEIQSHGIHMHLGTSLEKVESLDSGLRISLSDQSHLEVDLLIVSIGVRPNTQFVSEIGLDFAPNGAILVNEFGQTKLPDIYACGDCIAAPSFLTKKPMYVPLATVSNKFARVIAENMANHNTVAFEGTLGSACLKIMDMEFAYTGMSEFQAKEEGIDFATVEIQDKNHPSYYPGACDILAIVLYRKDNHKIIGAQMMGKQGVVLRVDVLATAITAGFTVEQLGSLDLCYAPPFARTFDIINVIGNVAKGS